MTRRLMPTGIGRLVTPRSVAIVGAKEGSTTSLGVVEGLGRIGFAGQVYAVNRTGEPAHGLRTFTSCARIGEHVDAAVLLTPAHAVEEVLTDLGAAGIRTAVLLASGWAETGQAGAAAQRAVAEVAQAAGVTLVGPNCLGFLNVTERTGAWIASVPPDLEPGPVAIVSQSGGIGSAALDLAAEYRVGVRLVVTTGNEAMVTTTDVIEHLVEDPDTRSIAVFAEALAEPERFVAAAGRARDLGKAIVILKAGSSEVSARNALSHTGSFVGDDQVVDAALRQAAVIRVRSLEELVLTAAVTAHTGVLRSPGVAVASISGGSVDVFADEAARLGIPLPEFDDESTEDIRTALPEFASVQNPLDVTGGSLGDQFERVVKVIDRQDEFGVVAVLCNVPAYDSCKSPTIDGLLETVGRGLASITKPGFLISQTVAHLNAAGRASTRAAGVVALPGLALGVAALGNLSRWSAQLAGERTASSQETADARTDEPLDGVLSEWSARRLLEGAGVPFVPATLVTTAEEAVVAAAAFDGPVAVKLVSPDVAHKSDIGAVRLDARGQGVRRAFDEVVASARNVPGCRIEGVLVSPMRRGGVELLVGVHRDPQWGPVLAVGLGGVHVEVLGDVSLRILPVSDTDVHDMLAELRGAQLLDGVRGAPGVDRSALVSAVRSIADAAWRLGPGLESLEINPLLADPGRAEALDAFISMGTVTR